MKTWSKDLHEKTREEIEEMITIISPDGELQWVLGSFWVPYARFKHIEGRFGKMSVENAHKNYLASKAVLPEDRLYIIECENGKTESFKTVDKLIESGWVLD